MIDIHFREMAETDRNFVVHSWLQTFSHTAEARHSYDSRIFQFNVDYNRVIDGILSRSRVVIASLAENHDVIAGWMCVENMDGDAWISKDGVFPPTLHYVLVKKGFREIGVAGQLLRGLDALPLAYTHMTGPARRRLRIPETWAFRPFRRYA